MTASSVILDADTRDAWNEYLGTIHDQPEDRYEVLEPWAWVKLVGKLATIEARRSAIGVAA